VQGALGNIQDGRWTPDGWADIRCDEDYERFYQQSQAEGGRKLPPPLDNRTVYAQLPPHLQQQLTQQQQQALAARLSPGPSGATPSGWRGGEDTREARGVPSVNWCVGQGTLVAIVVRLELATGFQKRWAASW